jgi:hypothetical protein
MLEVQRGTFQVVGRRGAFVFFRGVIAVLLAPAVGLAADRLNANRPALLIFDLPGSVHVSAINLSAMVNLACSRRSAVPYPVQSRLSRGR